MDSQEPIIDYQNAQAVHDLDIILSDNHDIASPLRYPGGKSVLSSFISKVLENLDMENGIYVEPYAGGAGIALRLLNDNQVSMIVLNDLDPCVFAFWDSVVNDSDAFLELFDSIEPSIEEWRRQKQIYKNPASKLELGFAFFFLNRTNRSGVINAGVIGGLGQNGRYKIDARYNKRVLRKKLEFIGEHSDSIDVKNMDGEKIINEYSARDNALVYADPPYVNKGSSLYMNAFSIKKHRELATLLNSHPNSNWLLTYDDTELIRQLYKDRYCGTFSLAYSASSRRLATELLVASDKLKPTMNFVQGVTQ